MPLFIHHASVTVASGSNSAVQHQNARSSPQHNPTAWRTWKPPATWQALTTRSTVATRNFASTWTTQATWTSAISSPNTNTKQHYIACNIAKRLSSTTAISGWREKTIHIKTRPTAIPLHGFVITHGSRLGNKPAISSDRCTSPSPEALLQDFCACLSGARKLLLRPQYRHDRILQCLRSGIRQRA